MSNKKEKTKGEAERKKHVIIKTNPSKMTDININISIITLDKNDLNSPIKRHSQNGLKKKRPKLRVSEQRD